MKNISDTPGGNVTINCILREEIIFKTFYKAQLLVPSFGFPPKPRRCQEVPEDLEDKAFCFAGCWPCDESTISKRHSPPCTRPSFPIQS